MLNTRQQLSAIAIVLAASVVAYSLDPAGGAPAPQGEPAVPFEPSVVVQQLDITLAPVPVAAETSPSAAAAANTAIESVQEEGTSALSLSEAIAVSLGDVSPFTLDLRADKWLAGSAAPAWDALYFDSPLLLQRVNRYLAWDSHDVGGNNGQTTPWLASVEAPATLQLNTLSGNLDARGSSMGLLAQLPLSNSVQPYAKLGRYQVENDLAGPVASSGAALDTAVNDWQYGVGMVIPMGSRWSARLEWQRYEDLNRSTAKGNLDVTSFSLDFAF